MKLAARIAVEHAPAGRAAARRRPGRTVRGRGFASADLAPHSPAHYLFPSRQVSLDPEIRDYARAELSAGAAGARGRDRADEPHQGDFAYRSAPPRVDHAADVVRAAPRRLPGFRAYHDLGPARPRPAGRLCQRLSAHRAAAGASGSKAPTRCMPGCWSGAASGAGWIGLDPTNGIVAGDDQSCSRSAATMPTSRRSTA